MAFLVFEVKFMDLDVPSSSLGAELKLLHPGGQISVPRRTSRPTEEGGVRLSLGASVEPGFMGWIWEVIQMSKYLQ